MSVLLVNLITFPPAQLAIYYSLAFQNFILYFSGFFIEIIVIIIEWRLYYIEFQKHVLETYIDYPLNSKNTLSITIVINLLSFIVLSIFQTYWMQANMLYSRYN